VPEYNEHRIRTLVCRPRRLQKERPADHFADHPRYAETTQDELSGSEQGAPQGIEVHPQTALKAKTWLYQRQPRQPDAATRAAGKSTSNSGIKLPVPKPGGLSRKGGRGRFFSRANFHGGGGYSSLSANDVGGEGGGEVAREPFEIRNPNSALATDSFPESIFGWTIGMK
jgi:hypothetical protein